MPDGSRRNNPRFSTNGKAAFALALKDPKRILPMKTPEGVRIVSVKMLRSWLDQGFVRYCGYDYAVTASGANAYLMTEGLLGG